MVNTMIDNLMQLAAAEGWPAEPLRLPAGQVADETVWRAKLEAANYQQLQGVIGELNAIKIRRHEEQSRERAGEVAAAVAASDRELCAKLHAETSRPSSLRVSSDIVS